MHNKEAIEMMRRSTDEIKRLQAKVGQLAPKAEAYDMTRWVIMMLRDQPPQGGVVEDVVWLLEKRIRELEKEEADAKATTGTAKPVSSAAEFIKAATEMGAFKETPVVSDDNLMRARDAVAYAQEKSALADKQMAELRAKPQQDEMVNERMTHGGTSEAMRNIGYNEDGV